MFHFWTQTMNKQHHNVAKKYLVLKNIISILETRIQDEPVFDFTY